MLADSATGHSQDGCADSPDQEIVLNPRSSPLTELSDSSTPPPASPISEANVFNGITALSIQTDQEIESDTSLNIGMAQASLPLARGEIGLNDNHSNMPISTNAAAIRSLAEPGNPRIESRSDCQCSPHAALPPWLEAYIGQLRSLSLSQRPSPGPDSYTRPSLIPLLPSSAAESRVRASEQANAIEYLQNQFQDENTEILALRSLGPNAAPAYRSYRQFLIIRTVCSILGLAMDTRKTQDRVLCDNHVNVCLQDVYSWVGINPGTFLNKKTDLANTSAVLDHLQDSLEGGHTSSRVEELYRMYWKHFLVSYDQWIAVPPSSWPESLGWKLKDMKGRAQQLSNLL
ncbi:hypothetical protein PQX77_014219 [Marasmius sp. AFHP31]|nr:hypothetical protein PQX77_014219 [Marasmius sp. AFHP31]